MSKTKIPADAKCVFKGIMFDVYHWEQTLFDGSTSTFEALKRTPAVFVIPLLGGKVCYVHQEQPGRAPYFSLPGGRIDVGEEPLQAAQRELQEETGLTSDNWKLLYSLNNGGKIDYPVYCFVARNCIKTAEQSLDHGGEKIEVMETPMEDFLTRVVFMPEFQQKDLRQFLQTVTPDDKKVANFKEKLINYTVP